MSKRLLFVGVSSMKDHAGQYKLYFIADALGRQGIPVTVLVPNIPENRAFFADKPHVETHFYEPSNTFMDMWRKSSFVNSGSWSAIWIVGVGVRSYILRLGSSRTVPIVKDFDEFPSMIENLGVLRRGYLRWMEKILVAQAQGFTCASAFLEEQVRCLRPGIGDALLRLPVAISGGEHIVRADLVRSLKATAGGRPVLLYVGTVHRMYESQLDEVIKLAAVLARRRSTALVRLVGGGSDLEYFKTKARSAGAQGSLEFTGHVPREDLASHMEAADVLVFPFAADAFNLSRCPTKAYNYAAANRIVVTNRTGEVARLFGEKALYYPERDVEKLADLCQMAMSQKIGYDNGIPFPSLTWDARARQFSAWLSARGWLPTS